MIGLIAAAGASLIGASMQSRAAKRASRAQERAAEAGIGLQRETRDMIREDMSPFRDQGLNALGALQYEMGLGAQPEGYGGFQAQPGYQFMMDQGLGAVEASAAGRGGLYSGSTMQALQERGMGIADQSYGMHMNRLFQLAGSGQNAAAGLAAANQNSANAITNLYGQQGNAQAAGAIGQGNAWAGGLNNLAGIYGMYQMGQNGNPWGMTAT